MSTEELNLKFLLSYYNFVCSLQDEITRDKLVTIFNNLILKSACSRMLWNRVQCLIMTEHSIA